MYARQVKMLALFMALGLLFPVGQAMGQILGGSASGSVTIPIAGNVLNVSTQQSIGQFNGSFTINSFARVDAANIAAVGMVRGTITNPLGQVLQSGLQSLNLPVNLSSLTATNLDAPVTIFSGPRVIPASFTTRPRGGRFTLAQFGSCNSALRIQMGSAAAVNIMGNSVVLSPFGVDVSGNTGAVGNLVCQILGLLGGFLDVVPLLNSLLGTVTGLLGGAGGGLLGGIL